MKDCVKIGLLGAGTVGGGVILLLENNALEITRQAGVPVRIARILERTPERVAELSDRYQVTDNFEDILNDPEIDIVIELIGREHPACEYITAALEAGKNVITANKDVIAKYGHRLAKIAAKNKVDFLFEASVGGGIPIILPLKTSLAANKIKSIMGIVNGTTNYMLTKMQADKMDFDTVLQEAQEQGYAESDPTADIGGLDAARKIAIMASLAFSTPVGLEDISVEGIENIALRDLEYAKELGYTVKLLALAKKDEQGALSLFVRPTMLPEAHPLSNVHDVYNAIFVTGDAVGSTMFMGLGAGRMATASSIAGDIIESSRNIIRGATGRITYECFEEKHLCPIEKVNSPSYIRLQVYDKPGVLACIAAAFGDEGVSLKNVVQKAVVNGYPEIVVITYSTAESNLRKALDTLAVSPVVEKICSVIHVEDNNFK